MTELSKLLDKMKSQLLPEKSKDKYLKLYEQFKSFVEAHDTTIGSEAVLGFLSWREHLGYKASTLWQSQSMLKTALRADGQCIPQETWEEVQQWLKTVGKNHVKKKAYPFNHEELRILLLETDMNNPVEVQESVMIIFGHLGGLRASENYGLTWEDVVHKEDTAEVWVTIKSCKNRPQGKSFVVTSGKYYEIVIAYFSLVENKTGFFYRAWHKTAEKFSVQRRGQKWFQQVPKKLAERLGLESPENYSHHSFRRTMATALHEEDATLEQIRMAGSWRSSGIVSEYVAESAGQKRKTANLLQNGKRAKCGDDDKKTTKVENKKVTLDGNSELAEVFNMQGASFSNCSFTVNQKLAA